VYIYITTCIHYLYPILLSTTFIHYFYPMVAVKSTKATEYIKLGSLFIILMTIGIFYRKYDDKLMQESMDRNDGAIRDYLLTDSSKLGAISGKKPILWIPVKYEYNSRRWQSFGSRSSFDLNQPYIYLTVKSIIARCKDSFHICLVDDSSYARLLPGWKYGSTQIPEPIMAHARKLAIVRLLRTYGGMTVPPSFLCTRDLSELYASYCNAPAPAHAHASTMFVSEAVNRTTSVADYTADIDVMGCTPDSESMRGLEDYLVRLLATDSTNAMDCVGKIEQWCNSAVSRKEIQMVPAELVGVRDGAGKRVQVEELLASSYITFDPRVYGILIPSDDILNRTAYQWFAQLSGEAVLTSNTIIGKYILLANVPGDKNMLGR
jgi:hypothetical protein